MSISPLDLTPTSLNRSATNNMTSSFHRSASVTKTNRCSATPSLQMKRSSAYLLNTPNSLDFGSSLSVDGSNSALKPVDETSALKRTIEAQAKQVSSLRSRIADLEKYLEQGSSPEVERLSKELSTLEDLFAQTQRDNESKHAEGERQKQYVKELENLLNTDLGPSWRTDHNLYPPAQQIITVTASTPLPKPKPPQPLRHSVSFSAKRSTSNTHHRASSAMDLNVKTLQAVSEVAEVGAMDDTPTGALKRLNGKQANAGADVQEQGVKPESEAQLDLPNPIRVTRSVSRRLSSTTSNLTDVTSPSQSDIRSINVADHDNISRKIDSAHIDKVIQLLSSLDTTVLTGISAASSASIASNQANRKELGESRQQHMRAMKRMLEEQEQRLAERETRLSGLVGLARAKEKQYMMTG